MKSSFDRAAKGHLVIVERGGIDFAIVRQDLQDTAVKHFVSGKAIENKKQLGKARSMLERQNEKSMGFCKNGHPIPEGRDKCLGKGCKYS